MKPDAGYRSEKGISETSPSMSAITASRNSIANIGRCLASLPPTSVRASWSSSVSNPVDLLADETRALGRELSQSLHDIAYLYFAISANCVITTAAPCSRFSGVGRSRVRKTLWSGRIFAMVPCLAI